MLLKSFLNRPVFKEGKILNNKERNKEKKTAVIFVNISYSKAEESYGFSQLKLKAEFGHHGCYHHKIGEFCLRTETPDSTLFPQCY